MRIEYRTWKHEVIGGMLFAMAFVVTVIGVLGFAAWCRSSPCECPEAPARPVRVDLSPCDTGMVQCDDGVWVKP